MADMSSLVTRVEQHAVDLCAAALIDVEAVLDELVPDSDQSFAPARANRVGPKLRDTRVVTGPELRGTEVVITVAYLALHAEFTNVGVEAHPIKAVNARSLAFYWPKAGEFVFPRSVQWEPGPGVARNIGWFGRGLEGWSGHLQDATSQVQS